MIDTTLIYAFSYLNVSIIKPWNYSYIKLSILISVISTQKGLKTKLYGTDKEEDIYVGFPKH